MCLAHISSLFLPGEALGLLAARGDDAKQSGQQDINTGLLLALGRLLLFFIKKKGHIAFSAETMYEATVSSIP